MLDQPTLNVNILDGSPLFAKIADHARPATGAIVVTVTTWSPFDEVARTQATSGFDCELGKKVLKATARLFPGFSLERATVDVHANELQEVVYLEGQSVTAPFRTIGAGVVPEAVLAIVAEDFRLNYTTVVPMLVQGRVAGAVSFHGRRVPAPAAIAAYEAFAQQAALTIEQAAMFRALQDELGDLSEARRLVTASNEAIRREIAERLHGPVQTQLIVADFTLRKASSILETAPAEAQQAIVDARALIDLVREKEIRDVSHILHPCVVGLGLAPAMRSLIDRFRPVMNIDLDLHADLEGVGTITAVEIDDATRLAAYRVVEEGLANAHKHGQATAVNVSITVAEGERIVVTVADNGVGFGESMAPGLGLRLIALKVEEVRGSWAIGRGEKGGARVTAELPLKGGALAGAEELLALSSR